MGQIFSREHPEIQVSPYPEPSYAGPDFNSIIHDGVPRMMQVTDDLHRMTGYIGDLRNIVIGLVALSLFGFIFFVILYVRHRRTRFFGLKRSYDLCDTPRDSRHPFFQDQRHSISTHDDSGVCSQKHSTAEAPKRTTDWIKNQNIYETPLKIVVQDRNCISKTHSERG